MKSMKRSAKVLLFAAAVLALAAGVASAQGYGQGGFGGDDTAGIVQVLAGVPSATLSAAEKDGLLLMREEEKLARDVYTALAAKWNIPVFGNIAASEQSHMDSVKVLLERYGIADPVTRDVPGKFHNSELQKLYDDLVAQGLRSLDDATRVGATIEDLDIRDLMDLITKSDNDDVRIVYQNLLKGSRNHLRSFAGRFVDWRTGYQPQYIGQDVYAKIMTTERETATVITDPVFRF